MYEKLLARIGNMSGTWLIFIGSVLWSTAGGVSKCISVDPIFLAGMRSLLAGLVLMPLLRPKRIVFDRWFFLFVGSYAALTMVILSAIRLTTASNALALQYTAPLWIVIVSFLFFKKRYTLRKLIPTAIIVAGIVIFLIEPKTGSNFAGNLLGVLSGAAFAAVTVCLRRVQGGGTLSTVAAVNLCAGPVILLIASLSPGVSMDMSWSELPYVLFLALFQLALGYVFYSMGTQKVPPQRATLLAVWEFVLTPLWAWLLVGELPTLYGAIGWIVLLAAIFIDHWLNKDEAAVAPPSIPQTAAQPQEQAAG
ncbi:MAG: DMT family transporter [Bacillota bacterium]|nr:DMT family transporter [Bacillota bacterium]